MSERDIIKIAVSSQAKAAIERICERYGMSQVEMASRLYLWFADQDEVLQTAILDILPAAVRPDVATMLLERLAAEDSSKSARVGSIGSTRQAKAARTARRSVHTTTQLPDDKSIKQPGRKRR